MISTFQAAASKAATPVWHLWDALGLRVPNDIHYP